MLLIKKFNKHTKADTEIKSAAAFLSRAIFASNFTVFENPL